MLLNLLIFLPILGGAIALATGRRFPESARNVGLAFGAVSFVLALALLNGFSTSSAAAQYETVMPWVPAIGINFHVAVDGLSILLVATTALMGLVALLASWLMPPRRLGAYTGLILLLQGTVTGAFSALDLILFFAFWEAMLIPMYLMVGILGGPTRIHAAVKFFLYTTVGSLLMLVGMLAIYFNHLGATGQATFDLAALAATPLRPDVQMWVFVAFALAFAIKVPVWPLHTWLPDTYTQSPLPALVLGTMLVKVGAYGFLRFCLPLLPSAMAAAAPTLAALGVIGILYAGFVAVVQRDMIRTLAYSSVAHLGFVVLGIFSLDGRGVQGALLQMVNHSITAGALFLVASMLMRRTDTSAIEAMRGLAKPYPTLAALFLISLFASLGLPGLNGFAGEILTVIGGWSRYPILATGAALGTILSAVYLLWWYRRVMNGHPERPDATEPAGARAPLKNRDLTGQEIAVLVPMVAMMFFIGLYPAPFLRTSEATVTQLLQIAARVAETPHVPGEVLTLTPTLSQVERESDAGAAR